MVYDVLHKPGTAEEMRGLRKIAGRFAVPQRGRWLEPACGSGRFLRAGAAAGIDVAGFDAHPPMVAYARKRLPSADVRCADMRDFAIGRWEARFAFAFNTINTIRHLTSDQSMLDHFACMNRCLRPGGVYIVGLSLAHYGHEAPSEDVWTARRGRLGITQIVQYEPPDITSRVEHVASHLVIERPRGTEHRDSAYSLRSYNLDQWRGLLAQTSLAEIACVDEQGRDIQPVDGCYRLFVLQRPER